MESLLPQASSLVDWRLLRSFVYDEGIAKSMDFEHFHVVWLFVFALGWAVLRKIIVCTTDLNPGRTVGLLHALACIAMGVPTLDLLTENSIFYPAMQQSMIYHRVALSIICHVCCYMSVGYFIMDCFFLVGRSYLKHHIGAILVWLLAAFHYDISIVHGVVIVCLFESGAVLVQVSRLLKNYLSFRTLICLGYTMSRIGCTWYWGFCMYSTYYYVMVEKMSLLLSLTNIPIHICLGFLVLINLKWATVQWQTLLHAFQSKKETFATFYDDHQNIIGNVAPSTVPVQEK